jgi:hypothetical protein
MEAAGPRKHDWRGRAFIVVLKVVAWISAFFGVYAILERPAESAADVPRLALEIAPFMIVAALHFALAHGVPAFRTWAWYGAVATQFAVFPWAAYEALTLGPADDSILRDTLLGWSPFALIILHYFWTRRLDFGVTLAARARG